MQHENSPLENALKRAQQYLRPLADEQSRPAALCAARMSIESAGQHLRAALGQMITADRQDLADQVAAIAHRLDVFKSALPRKTDKQENPQEEMIR
ncbi:hypothetical protein B9Z44_01215 [Limnohabitans curvus]|jgi:hypothetical protein|uniref:Uncharacterized protein n=1 Tax=Limnohabitans curvus TaxID=323423 RepID=A0A315EQV7_9BURK|nr:hypothetical protein [Limnohabitans curvus]PUE58342.1 hypothetical protein B9Z44_01215 [Limnohabitans curvus]